MAVERDKSDKPDGGEPFARRWSRLKRGGGAAPVVADDGAANDAPGAAPAETRAGEPPAEADPAADLPDVESLDKDSDYTPFLRDGVPEELSRRALRKLWRSDPLFAQLDGLNDYDEDFRAMFAEAVTKAVRSAYKVGKGMVSEDEAEAPAAPPGDDRDAADDAAGDAAEAPSGDADTDVGAGEDDETA